MFWSTHLCMTSFTVLVAVFVAQGLWLKNVFQLWLLHYEYFSRWMNSIKLGTDCKLWPITCGYFPTQGGKFEKGILLSNETNPMKFNPIEMVSLKLTTFLLWNWSSKLWIEKKRLEGSFFLFNFFQILVLCHSDTVTPCKLCEKWHSLSITTYSGESIGKCKYTKSVAEIFRNLIYIQIWTKNTEMLVWKANC